MKIWAIIFVIGFCMACQDDSDKTDDCMGDPKGPVPCPEVLDPVCGCNGITYGNDCVAEAAGVKQWTKGECK